VTHETWRIVGYVLDVAVILSVVIAGIYFFGIADRPAEADSDCA
jgi:hypothetical protein